VSADAISLNRNEPSFGSADFCLSPEEIAKGGNAASTYIESLKAGEVRRHAEEALDTLAAVISGGVCDGFNFPWQQIRGYHSALALSIVKEEGAPANIEALRCRHDQNRKYQSVPTVFHTKQVQRMRTTLRRVIATCANLGYLNEDEMELALTPAKNGTKRTKVERTLNEGEVRALIAACNLEDTVLSCRDGLMISLGFYHGLRTVDIVNLNLDDLNFDNKTNTMTIRVRQPQGKRARRLTLANHELIALEDWLEARGRKDGALFCPVHRASRIEFKRLSATALREACDTRAERSGVAPFSPNDLAKSGPEGSGAAKKHREGADSKVAPEAAAVLYAKASDEVTETDGTEELIRFPYSPHTVR